MIALAFIGYLPENKACCYAIITIFNPLKIVLIVQKSLFVIICTRKKELEIQENSFALNFRK